MCMYMYTHTLLLTTASLVAQTVKNLPAMQETQGLTPGLGRSPGGGEGNPLQYSCLENSMDRGAWWANSPLGYKDLDTTEQLSLSVSQMHTHTFIYV